MPPRRKKSTVDVSMSQSTASSMPATPQKSSSSSEAVRRIGKGKRRRQETDEGSDSDVKSRRSSGAGAARPTKRRTLVNRAYVEVLKRTSSQVSYNLLLYVLFAYAFLGCVLPQMSVATSSATTGKKGRPSTLVCCFISYRWNFSRKLINIQSRQGTRSRPPTTPGVSSGPSSDNDGEIMTDDGLQYSSTSSSEFEEDESDSDSGISISSESSAQDAVTLKKKALRRAASGKFETSKAIVADDTDDELMQAALKLSVITAIAEDKSLLSAIGAGPSGSKSKQRTTRSSPQKKLVSGLGSDSEDDDSTDESDAPLATRRTKGKGKATLTKSKPEIETSEDYEKKRKQDNISRADLKREELAERKRLGRKLTHVCGFTHIHIY